MKRYLCNFLSLTLMLTMCLALTIPANASKDGNSAYNDTNESATTDADDVALNDGPTTADGSVIVAEGDPYLYDIAGFLTEAPTLVVDEESGLKYLKFGISNVSKLEYFFRRDNLAFRLESNLSWLEEHNDLERTLRKPLDWRNDETTIASHLSEATLKKIESLANADGYEALNLIKLRPEYLSNERLRQDVNYYADCMENKADDILNAVQLLRTNEEKLVQPDPVNDIHDLNMTEVTTAARKLLNDHPEFQCLDEVWRTAISMPTSKFLTIQTLGQERVDELYAKVEAVAKIYWPSQLDTLNHYYFAVPFPEGTIYQWPSDKLDTEKPDMK